jgi:hypothetical protein
MSKYRLNEAVEAIDTITDRVGGLTEVAIIDVADVYGIEWADLDLKGDATHRRRFARMLVERLLFEDDIYLDVRPDPDSDPRENAAWATIHADSLPESATTGREDENHG